MNPSLHFLTKENWQWNLLFFIYGLSFFLMGFGILLKARRGSNLRLGRCLPCLAFFGIFHGIVEWGYNFIPTAVVMEDCRTFRGIIFNGGHALLLGLSYLFLLYFGVNLLGDIRHWPSWRKIIPIAAFGGWLFYAALTFPGVNMDVNVWFILIEIAARYMLATPGALISGLAILAQGDELRHLRQKSLKFFLNGAASALFLYTVGGGLLVPPAPFFPANVFNTDFMMRLGLPAQALRIFSSILVAFFIFRLLDVYDAEERYEREKSREREMIWREREKIRRDLHDGIIQSIYALALGLQHCRLLLADEPSKAAARMFELSQQAEKVIADLRQYLAGLDLGRELPPDPVALVDKVMGEAFMKGDIKVKVRGNRAAVLDGEQREHLYYMMLEILSNITRHAGASQVWVDIDLESDGFRVKIADNGKGFLTTAPGGGHGLKNLNERAALAGGWLDIESSPGRGTAVTFWLPYGGDEQGGRP
ncbi:MAG: sensor histidine kinase [Moorella humiferrea]|nr:sensor histidine kinase [Moorella humiferrea]